jgi:hypothetical protein
VLERTEHAEEAKGAAAAVEETKATKGARCQTIVLVSHPLPSAKLGEHFDVKEEDAPTEAPPDGLFKSSG